ncbi:TetR family transcriptional regulator [Paenibacillus sp. HJL G12]|uniref:TetR family transcriptional regulator n=1 Tax=Paenibacillus dendrobii TaxID=2691084 RepID=A0A7X3ILQ5_9BACL|nr:TetR/AcrR family transcriptional regulator [Paenibacillus dendrobii]MWV46244.1 TetR family transcriptional regulator [Paenibacillus dendrobii]
MSEVKTKIIQATLDSIAELGASQLSLRDISARASVALSQIHYHFQSKENLIAVAANTLIDQLVEELLAELEGIQDPLDRTIRTIDFIYQKQITKSPFVRIYFELAIMSFSNPLLKDHVKQIHQRVIDCMTGKEISLSLRHPELGIYMSIFLDGVAFQTFHETSPEEINFSYQLFLETIKKHF